VEPHNVIRNNQGFTLVESMVAILLLSIMMLASFTGLIASYRSTATNALRDEGVILGQEMATLARNTPYASLANSTTYPTRQVSNATVTYTVQQTVSTMVIGLVSAVQIDVSWGYQGQTFQYTATAIVGNT